MEVRIKADNKPIPTISLFTNNHVFYDNISIMHLFKIKDEKVDITITLFYLYAASVEKSNICYILHVYVGYIFSIYISQ